MGLKTRKRTPGLHSPPLSTITAYLSPEIKHKARCHSSHAICSTPPPLSSFTSPFNSLLSVDLLFSFNLSKIRILDGFCQVFFPHPNNVV